MLEMAFNHLLFSYVINRLKKYSEPKKSIKTLSAREYGGFSDVITVYTETR